MGNIGPLPSDFSQVILAGFEQAPDSVRGELSNQINRLILILENPGIELASDDDE